MMKSTGKMISPPEFGMTEIKNGGLTENDIEKMTSQPEFGKMEHWNGGSGETVTEKITSRHILAPMEDSYGMTTGCIGDVKIHVYDSAGLVVPFFAVLGSKIPEKTERFLG